MDIKKFLVNTGIAVVAVVGISLFVLAGVMAKINPQPMVVHIGPSGNALLRGTIESMGTDTLVVGSWGGPWTIRVPSSARIIPEGSINQFKVGDFVGVFGSVDQNASVTIDARMVHDWTLSQSLSQGSELVVKGVSGPNSLNVGQTGTWTINATDQGNRILSYSVAWGDQSQASSSPTLQREGLFQQTATFTHLYTAAGNYTITFFVKDNVGNTVNSSLTVAVVAGSTLIPLPSNSPHIDSLRPSAGFVGSGVTVTGSGFTATGNRLKFGDLNTENDPNYNLSSSDGTTLFFRVPSTTYIACLHQTPPCLIQVANVMTPPGNYQVSVINANGTSNGVQFTVLGQGSQP